MNRVLKPRSFDKAGYEAYVDAAAALGGALAASGPALAEPTARAAFTCPRFRFDQTGFLSNSADDECPTT